jgi:sarcosine oxidase, subunit gamma
MADVEIVELARRAQLNLRISPDAASSWTDVLGGPLPTAPNTVTSVTAGWICWLGPDEWLLVGAFDAAAVSARLREAAAEVPISVVDVSAARTAVQVRGPASRTVLAHGCALDLDLFAPAHCAQTKLALANVILVAPLDQPDFAGAPEFEVLVRASFTRYVTTWLADAATEYLVG